jgi:hypothetical protein
VQIRIAGEARMRAASRALKRAGGRTRPEFTKALRDAATPTLRKVKAAAEGMSIRGYRTRSRDRFTDHLAGGHIRHRVARVTEVDISTGGGSPRARFVVHNERLGNARNVPYLLDTGRPFRHPLPGNVRTQWAASRGEPWFYDNIQEGPFVDEVDQALGRIVDIAEGK